MVTPENVVPEEVDTVNERSLATLKRSIELSQGQFALILVRCSYTDLSEKMIAHLKQRLPLVIREIRPPNSVKALFTSIQDELRDEQPQALIISDLASITDIDRVLIATNQVREEFRKSFPFPVVFWLDDNLLHKLNKLAPDFKSWAATSIKFEKTIENLMTFLDQSVEVVFDRILGVKSSQLLTGYLMLDAHSYFFEVRAAINDLQERGVELQPKQAIELEFLSGIDLYENNEYDSAIERFQQSLSFWETLKTTLSAGEDAGIPEGQCTEREGVVLFYIGLCYYEKAKRLRPGRDPQYWQEAKQYLYRSMDTFERAGRLELVARFISKLGEVLQRLELWSELQPLVKQCFELHRQFDMQLQLAQDYSWQADLCLNDAKWAEARQNVTQALEILQEFTDLALEEKSWYESRFLLLLARSLAGLGQIDEAIANLETAKTISTNLRRPWIRIQILESLQKIYREQKEYLKAFETKQEQRSVEQQYAIRAFIGAVRLKPQRQIDREEGAIAQEIIYSGRRRDVDRLTERIGRDDLKLTIIHGQSGVGKSSILEAGLAPALKQTPIQGRTVLPVLLRSYTDWIELLGRELSSCQRQWTKILGAKDTEQWTPDKIIALLNNTDHNLTTVLIFDQFEEFFFFYETQELRKPFWEFLRTCLNIPYVKVILALREDYLHFLLECDRLINLDVVSNNILDKNIRYYLGNFSKQDAKGIIEELAARSQFGLEDSLVDVLVDDLAREQGEVLPIELQVVGAQLEGEMPPITTLSQYQALGQNAKEELVKRYLAEVVEDCGAENKEIAELILYYLTDEKGTRPLKTRSELERDLEKLINDNNNETSSLELVLDIFVKSGLVLLLREHPAERYQLVHDYLAAFIHRQQEPKLNELVAELEKERERAQKAELELIQQRLEIASKDKALVQQKLYSAKKQRRILGLTLLGTLLLLGIASFTAIQASRIRENLFKSLAVNVQTLSNYNKDWEALPEGLRLIQQLKSPIPIGDDAQMQAVVSLQQVLSKIKEHNRLEGHSDRVLSVSFSLDGQMIATASADKTVILWDSTGKSKGKLVGHKGAVRSVSFSPDGKTIVTGSGDRTVTIWDSSTGTIKRKLPEQKDSIYSVSFSHDGKTIISTSANGEIKLWDIDGHLKSSPKLNAKVPISSVIFSPDNRIIASAGYDGKIVLIDANSQKVVRELKPQSVTSSPVRCISFSPDGTMIAAGYEDGKIRLWDPINGKELPQKLYQFKGHTGSINSISFSPNLKNKTIASASDDGTIKFWDMQGNELQTFKGDPPVKSIGFSPDGKRIISGGDETVVRLWNLESPNTVLSTGDQEINSFSFNPAGTEIVSGSSDGTIKLWNLGRLESPQSHPENYSKGNPKAKPNSAIVSFSPDGKTIVYAINYEILEANKKPDRESISESIIYLWEPNKFLLKTFKPPFQGNITSLSFSSDGKTIATATNNNLNASDDNTVKLWDKDSKQLLPLTLKGHADTIKSISFSRDGKTIATGSVDQKIKLWNSSDGKEITTLTGHTGSVFDVKFSPNGEMIASASADRTIKLWQSSNGQEIRTLRDHTDSVYSVSFSPDGKIIASAGADKKIRLWSLEGKQLGTFEGHTGSINVVSFRPKRDDKLKYFLTSASADRTMIVWDLNLDNLTTSGCNWIKDYLNNRAQERNKDLSICKDYK